MSLFLKLFLFHLSLLLPIIAPLARADTDQTSTRQLSLENEPWTGDFEQMLERRLIRILAPYSRTLYFHDKGSERGLSAELARNFEHYINKKYAKQLQKRPVTVVIVPTTRDHLLEDLNKGLGDIVAGNLTETPERLQQADFIAPQDISVSELVLTGPNTPPLSSLDDLAGQKVHVRKSSSYFDSLNALNKRLESAGKMPIQVIAVPEAIEDEDLMEMLNAGVVGIIVVDDWKADIWAKVLPNIKVTDLVVRDAGHLGWAFRKQSPGLREALTDFYVNDVKKRRTIEHNLIAFDKRIKQITDNTADKDWERFADMLKLFEKYGEQYRFDPMMLAAQGYQESRLKQETRGPSGAIGVMQVLPSTGKSLRVGDIRLVEPNIHAGAKYLDELMSRYFGDANFSDDDRTLFAFASYNAGPGTINRLRKEALSRGLDPDRWFNNVELVAADKVGWETTSYVRNIYKYYAAYKLQLEIGEHQRTALNSFAP